MISIHRISIRLYNMGVCVCVYCIGAALQSTRNILEYENQISNLSTENSTERIDTLSLSLLMAHNILIDRTLMVGQSSWSTFIYWQFCYFIKWKETRPCRCSFSIQYIALFWVYSNFNARSFVCAGKLNQNYLDKNLFRIRAVENI